MTGVSELTSNRQDVSRNLHEAEESLPACFERVAERHRLRPALGSDVWQASYEELNVTANRLAHALMTGGGEPGDRIAILMQHDTPVIATLLAVLKANRVVVAFNPTNPPARLRQLMDDAEPALIVTDSANRELAADITGPSCGIVGFEDQGAGGPVDNLSIAIPPDQAAVLAYTSGSTGRPKAVMMTHRQFRRNVIIHTEAMQYTADDRLPLFGSLSGGQAVTMTWCALLNGAMLCPYPVIIKGVTGLAEWMIDRGITAYVSSASIFRNFMKTLDDDFVFSGVRAVRLASEPATADDFRSFQKHFPEKCVFVHTLSCSETCNVAVSRRSRDDTVPEGRLPIGLLSKGQEVLFLDDEGRPVDPGEVGEIVVRGRYVAAGYWRDPALTAERFSDDLDGSGTRLVHTGDLGRINSDGFLEFFGRRDDRVKIRGNRIEPSEVEDALHRLPGIDRAVVEAIKRVDREPALVGYVVTSNGHSWSPAELRHALRAVLPDQMVPSAFVFLASLPFTATGKIDREKLRQIHPPLREQQPGQQPQTETEALLADIWAEVFDFSGIGRQDDFFALGGDSLMAAVVAARVHGAVGVELNLGLFADHPTLAGLAAAIDVLRLTEIDDKPLLVRAPRDRPLPLSFAQERTWKFSQTPEQSAGYTVARAHRIVGPLDVGLLRDCMSYIARRHEILRTTFPVVDGRPVQIAHSPEPVPLPLLDLTGTADPEEQAVLCCRREAALIFDLMLGPLVRFSLIRLRENEHWLLRVVHHITCDIWSWEVYFRELALLYEAKLRGDDPPLPDFEPLQYADYAVWQRRVLGPEGPAYKEVIAWWQRILSGASHALKLPFMRADVRTELDPAEGVIYWGVDAQTSRQLNALARTEGATPYMVRLAAFVALLATETGEPDVILGTYVANRNRMAAQNMFGFFINLATLRFRYQPRKSFREWLSIVRATVVETEARSEIPYEQLCHELRQKGVIPPDIQVIFGISRSGNVHKLADLELTSLDRYYESMPWGFTLNFDEHDEEHSCRVTFDAGIYDPAGVRGLIDRFRRLLDAVTCNPDVVLEDLP